MAVDNSVQLAETPLETEDPPSGLGGRLQRLRKQFGLSQRELARRAGVTNSAISLIEKNQVSPSVASLAKVVGALGMTLGDFFADEPDEAPGPFFRAADLPEVGVGGLSQRRVGGPTPSSALQLLHERYAPGADSGERQSAPPGERAGLVLRGRLRVTVGALTRVLGPGDAYAFPSRLPHRFCNEGDEVCELVSAASSPTLRPPRTTRH